MHVLAYTDASTSREHRHTLATLRATRYLAPSFSSSAMTQSVIMGVHSAYKQSIIPWTRSSCRLTGGQCAAGRGM